MNPIFTWSCFIFAVVVLVSWISSIFYFSLRANKFPYKSKEWRNYDSAAFCCFILGFPIVLYSFPLLMLPFMDSMLP